MGKKKTNKYIMEMRGKRVKECMELCGLKNKDVAKKLDYTPQHISLIVNGQRTLTTEMAIKLSDYFTECINNRRHKHLIEVPFEELSDKDKEFYKDIVDENGYVQVITELYEEINYKYFLCESDDLYIHNILDSDSVEDNIDVLFKDVIQKILHFSGYDLFIKNCPNIAFLSKFKSYIYESGDIFQLFSKEKQNEIVNISTGEKIKLDSFEMFQLLEDYHKAIVSITERKFEEKKLQEVLNTPTPLKEANVNKNDIPFE